MHSPLVQAVNVGNLVEFQRVVNTHGNLFASDKTLSLITRYVSLEF